MFHEGDSLTEDNAKNQRKMLTYGLFIMTLTHVLTHVFGTLYSASFPRVREEFNLSIEQLGIIAAIPPLCQAILAIPAGALADRVGSKKTLLLSLVISIVGSILAAYSKGPTMLIIAVSLVYLNTTIYHPSSYSFLTRFFSKEERPKALGVHGAGGTFGMSLGSLSLSAFLVLFGLGWRQVYLFWTVPLLIGFLLTLRLPRDEDMEESVTQSPASAQMIDKGPSKLLTSGMLSFLAYSAIGTIGMTLIGSFMTLYMVDVKGFTVVQMGFLYGISRSTGLIAAPVGGVIASRFGAKKWLQVTRVLVIIMLGLVSISPGGIVFGIIYIVYSFSGTLGMAARSSLVASLTPRNQRGMGYALLFLPGSIMGAISPVLAANIISNYGHSALFPVSIVLYMIALGVLVFFIKDPDL